MAGAPTAARSRVAAFQELWQPARPYLNTASYGLPPRPTWDALQAALGDWREGRTSWEHWGDSTERARASFARLVGARPEDVATAASVSQLVGLVATALPRGARVVAPEVEFTSVLWPFLAQRALEVDPVPLAELEATVDARTALVAFSAVQSWNGEVADVDSIVAAARAHDVLVLVDATQAVGWRPMEMNGIDFLVCAGYKWLMSPRGTAFMAVAPERLDAVRPLAANWWAGEVVADSYYGPPLRLAASARRLDQSPAWFSWVGTAPALELLERIGVDAVHEHDVGLANRFRAGLGLPPADSAIVSLEVPDARERLDRAGILASVRAGRLRVSFHAYNTEADVDAALEALANG